MPKYLVIYYGDVTNVVEADSPDAARKLADEEPFDWDTWITSDVTVTEMGEEEE